MEYDAVAAVIVRLGAERGLTVATAESLTAGLVAAAIADVPGASAVLRGGVVSYHSEVKSHVLAVPADLLAERGSVDPQVARAMAEGARRVCGADLAVATTGVAGPEPHDGQAVGTVHLGWAEAGASGAVALDLSELASGAEARAVIRAATCEAALRLLAERLEIAQLYPQKRNTN